MWPPFAATKATRETAGGLTDPNGAAKDIWENRLAVLLAERLNGQFERVLKALDNPPRIERLTPEFWASEEGQLVADLRPAIESMVMEAARAELEALAFGVDWTLINVEASNWARQYLFDKFVPELTKNTVRALQTKIAAFIETPGMTIGQLKTQLAPIFGEYRAQMIAVTETTRAFAEGQAIIAEEYAKSGIDTEPIWHTSNDEKVCAICGARDGKPTTERPPAHPNCRCWTTTRARKL